jgi:Leucine-rich repeat (LRR) protein
VWLELPRDKAGKLSGPLGLKALALGNKEAIFLCGLGIAHAADFQSAVAGITEDVLAKKDLRVLLGRNQLRELHTPIVTWMLRLSVGLTHLDLSSNQLTALPQEITLFKACLILTPHS